MVLRKVGEKTVNILVNGTQEQSYTQTSDTADYNFDVNSSVPDSFDWTDVTNGTGNATDAWNKVDTFSVSDKYVHLRFWEANSYSPEYKVEDENGNVVFSGGTNSEVNKYKIMNGTFDIFARSTYAGNEGSLSWDINSASYVEKSYKSGDVIIPPVSMGWTISKQ